MTINSAQELWEILQDFDGAGLVITNAERLREAVELYYDGMEVNEELNLEFLRNDQIKRGELS